MKWLKWQEGRQAGDYSKMLLATFILPLPFDLYLLRFPEGSKIDAHVDKVTWGRHFRLNIVLKKAIEGGEFKVANVPGTFLNTARVKFFRPDKVLHSVTEVIQGDRLVLSFGFVVPRLKELFRAKT